MRHISFIFVAGIYLISCSGIKVITDYDQTVDFSRYKTLEYWGWADNSDQILNRFDKERIENAFRNEFNKRGIEVVDKGNGDIIVSLYIVTEQRTQKTATTTGMGGMYGGYADYYGYGPGFGWGMGHSTTTIREYDYTVGTLAVSVYDAKKKELVWEAVGEGTVDENPNNAEEKVGRAVAKIMKDYPVEPASE